MATRPTIFKWRQTEPVLILSAVRWSFGKNIHAARW
jgi:hypothetical protein